MGVPYVWPSTLTVLFEDDCGLCRETIRQLGRWDRDGRLTFMPMALAASSGRPILEELAGRRNFTDAVHVVDESNGRVFSGGHAALAILDALPGGWLLRPWVALAPAALAVDVVCRVTARHHDRLTWLIGFQDEVSCPVEPAMAQRSSKRQPSR